MVGEDAAAAVAMVMLEFMAIYDEEEEALEESIPGERIELRPQRTHAARLDKQRE
ncbi:hypothetical protein PIB30_072130 [Stylosanthes scabra]|uniref:Uncharacterized protein n=1 Tax=Stylosanthes scabra TaxID=79078 RepID=A0ABU6VMM2_9FABA|nr:hypothetical protein [Stylosanthes scabra]